MSSELPLLRSVMNRVKSGFKSSKYPLHHLPSAKKEEYDPKASCIFIVEHDVFVKMTDFEIQEIFRNRHILVTHVPHEDIQVDAEGMGVFGSLSEKRDVQGESTVQQSVIHYLIYW